MKLGVIGEPCIDYIHREGQDVIKHMGGILYSTTALSILTGKAGEVYPIFNLGSDEYDNITGFLSKFKNVQFDYIYRCIHNTRVVKLYYKSGNSSPVCIGNNRSASYDREESSTDPAEPISFEQVKPALGKLNGLLINMVSGVDINLETLKAIRNSFKGYIHMDLHNVVMKTSIDGTRHRSAVNNWLEWCTNCDTLQMNEAEISVLSGEGLNEYETAEKILESGKVKSVTVTRGKQGACIYIKKTKTLSGEKYFELDKIDIPSAETRAFKDTTGCGDVLASAFFYKSIENRLCNLSASLHYANRLAGRNAELMGVEELELMNA